jgi:hypothetical protein
MTTSNDALRVLASRLGGDLSQGPQRFRENLEAGLVPLIRCALRTGLGAPPLVQWVRRQRANGAGDRPAASLNDPDATAPIMARQLCAALMRQVSPRPSLETVVGR